jgi:hypothetical protein
MLHNICYDEVGYHPLDDCCAGSANYGGITVTGAITPKLSAFSTILRALRANQILN